MTTVFPYAPEDNIVELFVNDAWTDLVAANKVRLSAGIDITRGFTSETSKVAPPSSCGFTVDNRTGDFSPRNPLGAYYGSIGQNTPVRVATRTGRDTFTGRTVSSGWGTSEAGGVWSTFSGTASNYSVGSGVALHVMPSTNNFKLSYLPDYVYPGDVEVRATVSTGVTDVTGGTIQPLNLVLGGLSTSDYFMLSVTISTAEVITLRINNVDGTNISIIDTTLSWAYTGQTLMGALHLDGQTLRGKIWDAAGAEPYDWDIYGSIGNYDAYIGRAPGWVGVRTGVGTGNTNVTFTATYDNFEVRIPRFAGECSSWPSEWDVSGNDVYVPVEAAGLRRRLSQGEAPQPSPFTRGNSAYSPAHLLYYPVEDANGSTSLASGLPGFDPMTISYATPTLASDSSYAGSGAIGKPNGSRWTSPTVNPAATGEVQLMFLLSVPSTGETDLGTFTQIRLSGTIGFVDLFYHTGSGGDLELKFYNQSRVLISGTGTIDANINGIPLIVSVELTQNGANVDWAVAWYRATDGGATTSTGTVATQTIGKTLGFLASPYQQIASSAMGHFALRNDIISIFSLNEQLRGYTLDIPNYRLARLAEENDNIPMDFYWDEMNVLPYLGVQKQKTLLQLFDETVLTDMGALNDSRGIAGFIYRFNRTRYNRDAMLTLDYATGEVVPPLRQVDDDKMIVNDYTASRVDGSSYRATQETGPMALTSPTAGGVGRYNDGDDLNFRDDSYLPDYANWRVHVGTVNSPRYPAVTANLAKLAASHWQQYINALSVNAGDRIEVSNPKALIIGDTISQLAVGYSETLKGKEHTITYVCVPAEPYSVGEAASDSGDTNPWVFRADTDGAYVTPAFISVGVASEGSNASRTPAMPASPVVGDTLVLVAAIRNSGTGTVDTPTDNTGTPYTLLADGSNFRVFGKYYTGVETAPTVTFTGGVANATCHAQLAAVRGVSITSPAVATQLNGSAQNVAYPALTVPVAYCTVLYVGWKQDDWTSVATLSGATEIAEVSTTTGDDAAFVWDYVVQGATAANISSGSFTVTGGASAISRGIVLALRPGSVPAGATSLKVATPSGPLWTTVADDYPLYLDVNGVKVRATACSGASSPQTFTVDALPAARASGLSVSVWHPPVLAQ